MRISDWSSDVCSSDLILVMVEGVAAGPVDHADIGIAVAAPVPVEGRVRRQQRVGKTGAGNEARRPVRSRRHLRRGERRPRQPDAAGARKSGVWGKSVSVRVEIGGRRVIKKKKK